ncbi:MAG: sigma-54 dependent transcriptional regulator [Bdellovibrionota bacterium]
MMRSGTQVIKVLLVDSDPEYGVDIFDRLREFDFDSVWCKSINEGLERLESEVFDLVFFDLSDFSKKQRQFVTICQEKNPKSMLIGLQSAFDRDLAASALDAGLYRVLTKPFHPMEFSSLVRDVKEILEVRKELARLKGVIQSDQSDSHFIAPSAAMNRITKLVEKISDYKTTCLIEGESGTGKELVAHLIHRSSSRRDQKFIAINCGAIPENLLESELFGYVKGAFTGAEKDRKGIFEEVDKGTLFLDEIGEMPLALQAKILRVLQEDEIRRVGGVAPIHIDVRIIAATLKDLSEEVKAGRFREDLFYRLNVLPIHIPPLRQRKEDIPHLVDHFVQKENQIMNLTVQGLDIDALSAVMEYDWPGNVRELENAIERAMILTNDEWIRVEHLPNFVHNVFRTKRRRVTDVSIEIEENLSIKDQIRRIEIDLITKALQKTKGNRTQAAKILEISHRSLLYKLKEYELADLLPSQGPGSRSSTKNDA